jgi:hypothetical protein
MATTVKKELTNEELGKGYTADGISRSKDNLMNYAPGGLYAGSGKSSSGGSSRSSNYSSSPYQDKISELNKALETQAMAGLDKQRNASLSNLSAEKATIEPAYQKQKIQAGVTAKQTARSFDEFYAQRGGGIAGNNKSGIAGQAQLVNNLGYQGAMAGLGEAESNAFADIARRETGINNNYNSDVQSTRAGIEAEGLKRYIEQLNADRTFGLQEQGLNNQSSQFNSSQNLAYQNADMQNKQWQQTYDSNQTQQQWENTFRQQGATADQAIQMAQLAMQQQNASRVSSGSGGGSSGGSISQSSNTGKTNQDDAIIEIDNQLRSGTSPGNIAYSIEQQREELKRQGINVDALIKQVWEMSGISTRPGEL